MLEFPSVHASACLPNSSSSPSQGQPDNVLKAFGRAGALQQKSMVTVAQSSI
jgi:hypothetical protein